MHRQPLPEPAVAIRSPAVGPRSRCPALVIGAFLAFFTALPAQQQVILQDVKGAIQLPEGHEDQGPAVEMFESPNLDRFLRRARQFLVEEKYREAILVLQTVIEGRTLEAVSGLVERADRVPDGAGPGESSDTSGQLADPAQTVFSADGRIYRPARRLCHEYLAGMPAVGIELYQSLYEALAVELLDQALHTGRISDLERVANRYFPTLAAGAAMQALADRQMHEGRYRAAVQVLRDLAELYPAGNLRQLRIKPLWCRFKVALCLRLAGEIGAALEAARALAAEYPDESLRVMGVLHPVRDLPESELFTSGDHGPVVDLGPLVERDLSWLDANTDELVPLWQFRFAGPDVYAPVKPRRSSDNSFFFGEGVVTNAAPPTSKYGTGTQIAFLGGSFPASRAVFLENYRLRVANAFTGLLQLEGDGESEAPPPREMRPRSRVPAYDFALQTPVEDDQRYYVIVGYNKISQSVDALKVNHVVAYDKTTCERAWSSADFPDGEDGLGDVTFLAAPTVFGEQLLAPTMRRGAYELQCMDRHTGRPQWRTRIHAGGTTFFKAPGTPVLVTGSLAYVLTNAGALAAVDAFAGDLRWIRKYERNDPLRPKPVGRRASPNQGRFGNAMMFVEHDLPGFLPSRLYDVSGAIVFAGCDGDMLMCVDGATGAPVWMVDGSTRYAPYGRMRYLVGINSRNLYVAAEADSQTHLVCIELASGVVRWEREVPGGSDNLTRWPGRGCVFEDYVAMPGDREVMVLDALGKEAWKRLSLPSFGVGDEPLHGPNNLYAAGPWLGVSYARGIEVYSTTAALATLAQATEDPMRRSELLVQAGRIPAALDVLTESLDRSVGGGSIGGGVDPALQQRMADQVVALARELALQQSLVAWLDRVRPYADARPVRLAWHLARLDLFRQMQDLRQYEDEQQRLYRYMEGKDDR